MSSETLIQNEHGQIKVGTEPQCDCLQIQFKNFLWQFSKLQLKPLRKYVNYLKTSEGFINNQYDKERVVITMKDDAMMGLLTRPELDELGAMLEQGEVEIARQSLIRQQKKEVI